MSLPPSTPRRHAVVLGGGIGGLLATRVLADFYGRVTVVDSDRLTDQARSRRGVPQAGHAHLLLSQGAAAMERLFPGLLADLERAGAPVSRRLDEVHLSFSGHVLAQTDTAISPVHGVSRPHLESQVLQRVRGLPNVVVLDDHDVEHLVTDDDRRRVTGVRIACDAAFEGHTTLDTDLVVVASGRSGRLSGWLRGMGYPTPKEKKVAVDVLYATRRLRFRQGALVGRNVVGVVPRRDRPFGMGAWAEEGDRWVVTLTGYRGHHPPVEHDAWLAGVAEVAPPWFAAAVREATVVEDGTVHRFPASLRRRFDRLRSFPEGLLATGDTVCSFNPVYAQGMTVAALEALALSDVLTEGDEDLAARFFRAAKEPIDRAWRLAATLDLAMPEDVVPGPRALPVRLANAYVARYHAAAAGDPVLAAELLRVVGLEERLRAIASPVSLLRVARQVASGERSAGQLVAVGG